jgi:methylthioribose-1-phosphate isomerase
MNTPIGDQIPIEQRSPKEVTHHGGKQIAPDGVLVENPAFDVTPNKYVTAIITERGIAKAPYGEALRQLAHAGAMTVTSPRNHGDTEKKEIAADLRR